LEQGFTENRTEGFKEPSGREDYLSGESRK